MVLKFINLKQKNSEIVAILLCLGNTSEDWPTDNMKRTGFNGYIYDFSVDYDATDVDDIKNIHKYLMKKNGIIQNVQNHKANIYFNKNAFQ